MKLYELIESMSVERVPDLQIGDIVYHTFLPKGGIVKAMNNSTVVVQGIHDKKLYKFDISSLKLRHYTEGVSTS